jgi:hypothetical protein
VGKANAVIFDLLNRLRALFPVKIEREQKPMLRIAWGNKVNPNFREKVIEICKYLGIEPSNLMSCIAFETKETFSPGIRNAAGSGAVGLIQFMASTAISLGTTTMLLSQMNAVDQLDYVKKYFAAYKGRIKTLEDTYMAILYPIAIGKPVDFVLFSQNNTNGYMKQYIQNKGLDWNKDGNITKQEACLGVRNRLDKGLLPENVFEYEGEL